METRRVSLTFEGGAMAALGYAIVYGFSVMFLIPAAWGAAAMLRWGARSIERSDGGQIRFEGRGSQAWPLFIAMFLLAILPQISHAMLGEDGGPYYLLLLTVIMLPLFVAIKLAIYRWIVSNMRFMPGGQANLTAPYLGYLGWTVLLQVSCFTIIGWAWVAVAVLRWLARHVQDGGYRLEFVGTGWGLLWHVIVWMICMIPLLPIPWILRWIYRWLVENTVVLLDE